VGFVDLDAINERLARRLVDRQFPQWSSLPNNPVARQGVDNRTFRLGKHLSVRLPAGDWYAQQVAKEQPRLAPLLPLPIPEPVAGASRRCATRIRGRSTAGSTAREPPRPSPTGSP
jgi:aminoglycoside phosphotransferase (APT) family kinase protein